MSQTPNSTPNPLPDLRGLKALLDAFPALAEALRRLADPHERVTVREIVNLYLEGEARPKLEPRNFLEVERLLNLFAQEYGDKAAVDCTPLDLHCWLGNPQWRSDWTLQRVCSTVQRCFNWASHVRLLKDNPFRGVRHHAGPAGRAMTDVEFRTLLRNTDALFRRVLLFLRLPPAARELPRRWGSSCSVTTFITTCWVVKVTL